MFKVSYIDKDKDGYLVDRARKFQTFQEACKFMRELATRTGQAKLVGKPTLEHL